MKALVLHNVNDLRLEEVPTPVPKADEVLIRTRAATICTSDLIDIARNPFGIQMPIVIGHEGAGVVEAVGGAVRGFKSGDAVTAHPVIPCGQCAACRRGLGHLCDRMDHLGVYRNGVFAEYFTIRADRVRMKPDRLSFAQSTLMEPVCVCMEALDRANVREGGNVLVIGDGPFGVIISKLCFARNPKRVVFVGRHDYRLSQVPGAIAINEKLTENVVDDILRATDGEGVDSAILAVGSARAMDICVESLRARGTLAVFSALDGKTPIDLFKLHVKELQINGSCNDQDCLDAALSALCDERLNLGALITHELPLERFEEAINLARNGKDSALKVSMIFGGTV